MVNDKLDLVNFVYYACVFDNNDEKNEQKYLVIQFYLDEYVRNTYLTVIKIH